MMRHFFAAVQFLTVVPAASDVAPARAALFFPLVGAMLGLAAGAIRSIPVSVFPPAVSAALALLFLIAVTGALHEDGLADVLDAFRAGRSPERIHAIMKDSRIGVYGTLAIGMTLLLRWQAIAALDNRAIPAMAAVVGASRGAMVAFAYVSRPSGDGLGKAFCLGLRRPAVLFVSLQAAALGFLCGPSVGIAALCGNMLVIALARVYFHRRAGGITGDCMGAVCQISEVLMLLIFICPLFI